MQAKDPQRSTDEMTSAYVELVKQIPEVQLVVLVKDDPYGYGPRIWVIIDAPPFEPEPRYRVYYIDSDIIQRFEDFPFGFRLINMRELQDELEDYLPQGDVLFDRKRAA